MIEAVFALVLGIQDSQTTCTQMGAFTNCNTTRQSVPFNAYNSGFAGAQQAAAEANAASDRRLAINGYRDECAGGMWLLAGCSRADHDQAREAIASRGRSQELRRSVTDALAADDCEGAIQTALRGGDMALAREARDFCR